MADTPLTETEARHLLRRTGFGAPQSQVDKLIGVVRSEAVDDLLKFKPQGFKPGGKFFEDQHDKWIKFMLKTKRPLQEKLVLFWHDHFATGISKVQDTKLMGVQNQLLRKNCKGNFRDMVKAVNRDPAMMEYLDTVRNRAQIPNENYARELMELFTLGVKDSSGNDNYTQNDIVQIARAFTGWRYDKEAYLNVDRHDFSDDFFATRGAKRIFTTVGMFGASGQVYAGPVTNGGPNVGRAEEGPAEIDAVTDIIFEHRDSDGKNTVARRIARRLIEYFVGGPTTPSIMFVDDVVGTGPDAFDVTWDLNGLLRRLFTHDSFFAAAGAPSATNKSVRWPVDLVVTTLRMLRVSLKGSDMRLQGGDYRRVLTHLTNMGQVLLDPPSVFGWEWETSWVSSSTLLARYSFVRDLTVARDGGGSSFRPERLVDLSLTDPAEVVIAALLVLGVPDLFGATERTALANYLTAGGATVDLLDDDYRNKRLHGLFALIMQSPAYQMI